MIYSNILYCTVLYKSSLFKKNVNLIFSGSNSPQFAANQYAIRDTPQLAAVCV